MKPINRVDQQKDLFDVATLRQAINYHQSQEDTFQRGYGNQVPEIRQTAKRSIFGRKELHSVDELEHKLLSYQAQHILLYKVLPRNENPNDECIINNARVLTNSVSTLLQFTEFEDLNSDLTKKAIPLIVDYLDWFRETISYDNPSEKNMAAYNGLYQVLCNIAQMDQAFVNVSPEIRNASVMAKKALLSRLQFPLFSVGNSNVLEYKAIDLAKTWLDAHKATLKGENAYTQEEQELHDKAHQNRSKHLYTTLVGVNGAKFINEQNRQIFSVAMLGEAKIKNIALGYQQTHPKTKKLIAYNYLDFLYQNNTAEDFLEKAAEFFSPNFKSSRSYAIGLLIKSRQEPALMQLISGKNPAHYHLKKSDIKEVDFNSLLQWPEAFWLDHSPLLSNSQDQAIRSKTANAVFKHIKGQKKLADQVTALEAMIAPLNESGQTALAGVLIRDFKSRLSRLSWSALRLLQNQSTGFSSHLGFVHKAWLIKTKNLLKRAQHQSVDANDEVLLRITELLDQHDALSEQIKNQSLKLLQHAIKYCSPPMLKRICLNPSSFERYDFGKYKYLVTNINSEIIRRIENQSQNTTDFLKALNLLALHSAWSLDANKHDANSDDDQDDRLGGFAVSEEFGALKQEVLKRFILGSIRSNNTQLIVEDQNNATLHSFYVSSLKETLINKEVSQWFKTMTVQQLADLDEALNHESPVGQVFQKEVDFREAQQQAAKVRQVARDERIAKNREARQQIIRNVKGTPGRIGQAAQRGSGVVSRSAQSLYANTVKASTKVSQQVALVPGKINQAAQTVGATGKRAAINTANGTVNMVRRSAQGVQLAGAAVGGAGYRTTTSVLSAIATVPGTVSRTSQQVAGATKQFTVTSFQKTASGVSAVGASLKSTAGHVGHAGSQSAKAVATVVGAVPGQVSSATSHAAGATKRFTFAKAQQAGAGMRVVGKGIKKTAGKVSHAGAQSARSVAAVVSAVPGQVSSATSHAAGATKRFTFDTAQKAGSGMRIMGKGIKKTAGRAGHAGAESARAVVGVAAAIPGQVSRVSQKAASSTSHAATTVAKKTKSGVIAGVNTTKNTGVAVAKASYGVVSTGMRKGAQGIKHLSIGTADVVYRSGEVVASTAIAVPGQVSRGIQRAGSATVQTSSRVINAGANGTRRGIEAAGARMAKVPGQLNQFRQSAQQVGGQTLHATTTRLGGAATSAGRGSFTLLVVTGGVIIGVPVWLYTSLTKAAKRGGDRWQERRVARQEAHQEAIELKERKRNRLAEIENMDLQALSDLAMEGNRESQTAQKILFLKAKNNQWQPELVKVLELLARQTTFFELKNNAESVLVDYLNIQWKTSQPATNESPVLTTMINLTSIDDQLSSQVLTQILFNQRNKRLDAIGLWYQHSQSASKDKFLKALTLAELFTVKEAVEGAEGAPLDGLNSVISDKLIQNNDPQAMVDFLNHLDEQSPLALKLANAVVQPQRNTLEHFLFVLALLDNKATTFSKAFHAVNVNESRHKASTQLNNKFNRLFEIDLNHALKSYSRSHKQEHIKIIINRAHSLVSDGLLPISLKTGLVGAVAGLTPQFLKPFQQKMLSVLSQLHHLCSADTLYATAYNRPQVMNNAISACIRCYVNLVTPDELTHAISVGDSLLELGQKAPALTRIEQSLKQPEPSLTDQSLNDIAVSNRFSDPMRELAAKRLFESITKEQGHSAADALQNYRSQWACNESQYTTKTKISALKEYIAHASMQKIMELLQQELQLLHRGLGQYYKVNEQANRTILNYDHAPVEIAAQTMVSATDLKHLCTLLGNTINNDLKVQELDQIYRLMNDFSERKYSDNGLRSVFEHNKKKVKSSLEQKYAHADDITLLANDGRGLHVDLQVIATTAMSVALAS